MTATQNDGVRTRSPLPSTTPGDGVDRLLVQVARGNSDAFAVLYEQVAGTVYGLVRRMAGDSAVAQDVTRGALTEVWHTASGFRPANGSGTSWILAIARRRAVAQVRAARKAAGRPRGRSRGRRKPSQAAQLVQQLAEQAELTLSVPPGEAAQPPGNGQSAAVGQLETAGLAALPEPQRQALVLVLYGGYTQGQVADLLGVRSGTVAAWLRDGLPRLR
jgi:RNA polymerase sigma-70 factor, ECF subfamily